MTAVRKRVTPEISAQRFFQLRETSRCPPFSTIRYIVTISTPPLYFYTHPPIFHSMMILPLLLSMSVDTITFTEQSRDLQLGRDKAETRVMMMVKTGRCSSVNVMKTTLTTDTGFYVWTYTVECVK